MPDADDDTQETTHDDTIFSVVVPLCNKEENLPELYARLISTLEDLGCTYELLFVNDGSNDGTTELLAKLAEADEQVRVLHFSRNFGHQAAVTAGLQQARGQAVIVLDGDLQDPPEVIPQLVERWREGYDVVYAVRTKRKEHWVKRLGYYSFYRVLRAMAEVDVPLDSGDVCLMDRRVVQAMNRLPECDRFVRGLRSYVGFRQIGVEYERHARHAGVPKYTMKRLARLAVDGVLNLSTVPLRAILWLGVGLFSFGGLMLIATLLVQQASGWFAMAGLLVLLSGVQMTALGIIALYVLKIFVEVKQRPSYVLQTELSPRRSQEKHGARRHPAQRQTVVIRGSVE